MSKSITITVSISPVGSRNTSGGTVRVRVPLTDPDSGEARDAGELETAAIALGCKKLYGRDTFWWADSGLAGYGQVMRPCKTGGSDAVTYRARLDVDVPDIPASHLHELEARDARWQDYQAECQRDYAAGYDAYAAVRHHFACQIPRFHSGEADRREITQGHHLPADHRTRGALQRHGAEHRPCRVCGQWRR